MHLTSTRGIIVWSLSVWRLYVFVCVWFCLFMCLTEGDSSCQRCVLGSKERKLGFASAVVEQRASGCRLQRLCMNCLAILHVSQCNQHCHWIMLYGVLQQYGTSALMVASYSGHYECVRELILQGADINLQREVCISSMLTLVL